MFDDLFYPTERKGVWTKEMILLSLSNLLLYISLYIFLSSLPYWLVGHFNIGLVASSLVIASFAIAIFIPGPFNNYMLDAFKRQRVGFWAFVLLGLASLGYLWSTSLWMILFIRICQGMLFSIITTTTSSTLVIDVTPTKKRTLANLFYSRVGRIGMTIGVIAGIFVSRNYGMDYIVYASCAMAVISGFLLLMIRVPFRAPLKPALVSLDRFLLPRAFPAALNMIFTPIILGIIISYVDNEIYFVYLAAGSLLGFLLMNRVFKNFNSKIELELSATSVICGYLLLSMNDLVFVTAFSFVLLGIGLSISANRFYLIIISIPMHCERGSANNTYSLIWEVGMLSGLVLGYLCNVELTNLKYFIPISLTLLSLLMYEVYTHRWYYKQMDK